MTNKNTSISKACFKHLLFAILSLIVCYTAAYKVTIEYLVEKNLSTDFTVVLCLIIIIFEFLCIIESTSFMDIILRTRYCKDIYNLSTNCKVPSNSLIRLILFCVFIVLYTITGYPEAGFITFFRLLFFSWTFASVASPRNKIVIYTQEYTHYLYADNPTNVGNIILEIVSVYILCNKKFKKTYYIKNCDVQINSLDIIYTSIYQQLLSDKYRTNNSLNECGQMLYMFLLDVINRQLKHHYISSDEYKIKQNELFALQNNSSNKY